MSNWQVALWSLGFEELKFVWDLLPGIWSEQSDPVLAPKLALWQSRAMNPRRFFEELKRRNVYKVAVAYAVVAWLDPVWDPICNDPAFLQLLTSREKVRP